MPTTVNHSGPGNQRRKVLVTPMLLTAAFGKHLSFGIWRWYLLTCPLCIVRHRTWGMQALGKSQNSSVRIRANLTYKHSHFPNLYSNGLVLWLGKNISKALNVHNIMITLPSSCLVCKACNLHISQECRIAMSSVVAQSGIVCEPAPTRGWLKASDIWKRQCNGHATYPFS